ncbi:DUF11 domain-containing protein [Flavisolibacter sp. BT320]|nr:DUF11 domain-containing protein [Flavisolibacter longurius]
MKLCTFFVCLLLAIGSFAQVPAARWTKYLTKAQYDEVVFDARPTRDGGLILAGADTGWYNATAMVLNKSIGSRPYLAKLDSNGTVQWSRDRQNSLVSPHSSAFLSVTQSADLGYAATGFTSQQLLSGDPTNPDRDLYLAKHSNNGSFQWEKKFGGTGDDRAMGIVALADNGFLVAGYTNSIDGDVTDNHSFYTDAWLLHLDNAGNIVWKKCLGGSLNDSAYAIRQTPDKGFLIAGSTASNNGDVSTNAGATDAWVIKTDSLGAIQWQKTYGGTGHEAFKAISLDPDGSYTFAGYSTSSSLLQGTGSGKKDLWVVKTSLSGEVLWSKLYGGTEDEEAFSVGFTPEGHCLVTGYTQSINGAAAASNGATDAWVIKLSSAGTLLWQKFMGTGNDEVAFAGYSLAENDFMIAGAGKPLGRTDFDAYIVRLGNGNTIKGSVFLDTNLNGAKDAGETYASQQLLVTVQKQDGYERSTLLQNGHFKVDVDTGSYTATVNIRSPYYQLAPSTLNRTFSSYFSVDSISFALQPFPNKQDLAISLFALQPARPGFEVAYRLQYKNTGTTTVTNAQVKLEKDARTTVVATLPAAPTGTGHTLTWSVVSLAPGDSASIDIRLQVTPPPAVNNGDTLIFLASISPAAGDETPQDNTETLKQVVVGSYDPNDKAENNGGVIPYAFVTNGESLQYRIRFQNTGTDTAFTVVVRDTLSSLLDASSLEMVSSSHPYTFTIQDGVHLAWTFTNILLPDSNRNEPASHGYIVYRIRPKTDVGIGEIIHNTASIYFDYNLPVVTNDAATLIQKNSIALPVGFVRFSGNRSSETVALRWQTADPEGIRLFDIERSTDGRQFTLIGKRVTGRETAYAFEDNTTSFAHQPLYYRLRMAGADGQHHFSQVLLFRSDDKTGSLEVYPNPVKGGGFVSFVVAVAEKAELQLLSAGGVIVHKEAIQVTKGRNTVAFTTAAGLTPGIYVVRLVTSGEVKTKTFTVQ